METFRSTIALILVLALAGCSAMHASLIGAPREPRLGPMPLTGTRLDELSGTDGFKAGVAAAEANILLDKLVFHRYGFIIESYPRLKYEQRYEKILARYGVSFDNPGCEFPPPGEANGYSHRMAQEVVRRFGVDFWQKVDLEARQ